MKQKLLLSPRQLRISRHSTRRGLFGSGWTKGLIIVLLAVLLGVALLFLQANKAVNDMKQTNVANKISLRSAVEDTTKVVMAINIQQKDETDKAVASLTNLTVVTDGISEACASASKPMISSMARNSEAIYTECDEITRAAREVRDSTNTFIPLAQYQVELTNALSYIVAYHRSDDKIDLQKGIIAWRATRDSLQKVTAPTTLTENNSQLINTSAEIIDSLEKARAAKDSNDNAGYLDALKAVKDQYASMNRLADPIHEKLVDAQKDMTNAARSI